MAQVPVYLEIAKGRVFAGAIEWPGWCRSGRDEAAALDALATYGARYARAIGRARAPGSSFEVVERLEGNATTTFGAPAIAPAADTRPLSGTELKRLLGLQQAAWAALDAAAKKYAKAELRKGPRGGGRDLPKIVAHVAEADRSYLGCIRGTLKGGDANALRTAILDTLAARARGDPPPPSRHTSAMWTPRYFVRRSAWHALDHAWEIEDRAT